MGGGCQDADVSPIRLSAHPQTHSHVTLQHKEAEVMGIPSVHVHAHRDIHTHTQCLRPLEEQLDFLP